MQILVTFNRTKEEEEKPSRATLLKEKMCVSMEKYKCNFLLWKIIKM